MEEKRVVRVGKNSEPSKVASSVLYMLQNGENVELSALGTSAAVLAKSVCLIANLNNDSIPISFNPSLDYVTDDFGETRTACKVKITIKE
ncbi:stage V sporulation protein S [Proteiniclasticum ruminis]|uniref:Stage V sporulation protein SpoVS n=1 Tax=Proteiniclasticum ruminis TaxID=398199 RepID=A0A1G8GIZ2_9CLOT|nr:stage V sporulation protein S [Proteiniclasticum ruminis]SDH94365.1 Stage V sporulation protein SpoVS [Proteiniclasticum ruminis]